MQRLVPQTKTHIIFDMRVICGDDISPSRPLCIAISTSPVHQNQLKQHDQVKHLHSDKTRVALCQTPTNETITQLVHSCVGVGIVT